MTVQPIADKPELTLYWVDGWVKDLTEHFQFSQ